MELSQEIKELADQCNPKQVRVVTAILSDDFESNALAYRSIYAVKNIETAKTNVSRMLSRANVKSLYEAMKEEAILESIISRSQAMQILSNMAQANLGDATDFSSVELGEDEDGNPMTQASWSFKDSKNIPKETLAAISELQATPQGLKIKLHDQKAAIKQLAEMAGWEAPKKIEHSGKITQVSKEMTDEEAIRLYQESLKDE